MPLTNKVIKALALLGMCLLVYATILSKHKAHAEDQQEVKPYEFAELPHGRIYKAVHEGCEIFIAEGEMRVSGAPDNGHFYTIATGRGCR